MVRRLVAAGLIMASIVVVVALAAPSLLASVRQAGTGPGVQPAFHLGPSSAIVRWAATPTGGTTDGCLFGLRITWLDPPAPGPGEGDVNRQLPKLVYEFVRAGSTLHGAAGPFRFSAGTYQFTTDGGCGWQARIEPAGPFDAPPSPYSPRMILEAR